MCHPRDVFTHLALTPPCSGTSGFVQLAYNLQTGEQVAIKFIERGIQMQRIVARELLNHRMCALHPHIVQLKVRNLPNPKPYTPHAAPTQRRTPVLSCLTAADTCRTACSASARVAVTAGMLLSGGRRVPGCNRHPTWLQEVFLTPHHLAIAMEYAAGGDLSEYVQANKLPGVRTCYMQDTAHHGFDHRAAWW